MNHNSDFYLGIDTSAYTTSLAIVDGKENLLYDRRMILPVKEGSLGMRQSDAVFAHINNLPKLFSEDDFVSRQAKPVAVAAAVKPRPVSDSYMPVFKVGEAFGLFLSRTMGLNFLASSHQEGHVMAGLWSAGLPEGRYLVVHLSGGTSEIIIAEEKAPGHLSLSLVGGSSDLKAGQFVDRLGMIMGLSFPAGPEMEKLARRSKSDLPKLPLAVCGPQISFSGPASQATRLFEKGCAREDLSRAVEICLADSVSMAINNLAFSNNDDLAILAVGGVMANRFIRERLAQKLPGRKLYFAEAQYSSDNAVGLAVQASRRCRREGTINQGNEKEF